MRNFIIKINGKQYDVEVEEVGAAASAPVYAAPVVSAAPAAAAAPAVKAAPAAPGSGEVVASPLPGSVVKVLKSSGDAVKKGETVVLLEAMKMENEIHATKDGTITSVSVTVGQTVDTGAPLFTIG